MKSVLKKVINALAMVAVAPLVLPELLARRIVDRDVWFRTQAELLSLVPGTIGIYVRGAYYHLTLRRCPLGCGFQFGTIINSQAEIGERVDSGRHVIIGAVTIGDDCIISEGAHILSAKFSYGTTNPTVRFAEQRGVATRVCLGHNCWIGSNAVVMAEIGDNCVVGAGAVVSRPFPSNKIIVGNPARAVLDTFDSSLMKGRKSKRDEMQQPGGSLRK